MRRKAFLCAVLLAAALLAAAPPAGGPRRVVSQTVGTDELLLALAEPGQIAALSHLAREADFSPVAREAAGFPALKDSDAESVLRFRPDLVLVASYTRAETLVLLKKAKVPVLLFDRFETLEDTRRNLRTLGDALGRTQVAKDLLLQLDSRVEALRKRLDGVRPVRVLAASVHPYTAGAGTTFQDLCEHAGAVNVAAEAGLQGHQPTPSEAVLGWKPEVLVASGEDPSLPARLAGIPPYKHLQALRTGRVVLLPGALMSATGQHRLEAYEALARALHPERFR
jgi:iron complex transport system substrate-binding protein